MFEKQSLFYRIYIMIFSSLLKASVGSLLAGSFLMPLNLMAQTETDLDKPSLMVDESKIYSISVKPNRADGASSYKLKIFIDEQESKVAASAVRPMDGRIVDVEIYDVDKDGVDELVVAMKENVSTSTKMHFDVFEFDGNRLSWIEDFSPVANLFSLYEKLNTHEE